MYDVLCLRDEYKRILADPSTVSAVYDRLTKQVAVDAPFVAGNGDTDFLRLEPVSVDLFADRQIIVDQASLKQRQTFVGE